MENKLKKEEIYVAVSDKKQAKQFKAILLALGEKISVGYWASNWSLPQTKLTFTNTWCVTNSGFERKEITIKQLIELLVAPKEVEKERLLISADYVNLFEMDMYFLVSILINRQWGIISYETLHSSSVIIRQPNLYKAFSTKQAALDWIEKMNKPNNIDIELLTQDCTATVEKKTIKLRCCGKLVLTMHSSDIELIAHTLNKLS